MGITVILRMEIERWPLTVPSTDNSGTVSELETLTVTLVEGDCEGRGEAAGRVLPR